MLEKISGKLNQIVRQFSGQTRITEKNIQDAVEEIKVALLEADVNLRVVRRFVNRTIEEATGTAVLSSVAPGQQFVKIVYDRLIALLGDERQGLELKGPDTTSVILFLGLQGSGKTTTAAKLALQLKKENRNPLLVAADLVRPAAVDQLVVMGGKTGIPVYTEDGASDPIHVVKNGIRYAELNQYDTVLLDTSGRLQIDKDLMNELVGIKKIANPDETLLVADAMTGQSAVDVAKEFDEKIVLTGIILSKFDSDTRGGAAISLKSVTGKPVKYIGVGEKPEDLEPFFPERIASRILGMGDVVSLVEKAQSTIDQEEAEALHRKMQSAAFTLEDYLDQFARIRKMGSLESLVDMIPGMQGKEALENIDEKEIKKEEAIILSMTPAERRNHNIIGPSRRKRIAHGSGTSVFEVNKLLKKFEKLRLMMKKMTRNKKYQKAFMAQMNGK
jgi:signal recognition particle subunit SRP54